MDTTVLVLMGIPLLVSTSGGILAALWAPSQNLRSLVQHFAAGVVLAALAVELVPEIQRQHAEGYWIAVAFAIGSLAMYGLRRVTESMERAGKAKFFGIDRGLLLATFVDVAVDGFIIGAGFAAARETGTVLAIGLSVELLFLGLALAPAKGGSRIATIGIGTGLGLTVMLSSILGGVLLAHASSTTIAASLAFSAAALVYLVTEELLMEAHEHPEPPGSTLVLFAGFLAFWCVGLFAE